MTRIWRMLVLVLALSVTTGVPSRSMAQPDPQETKAVELYATGRYGEAAELYTNLYQETQHPTYLRNLGRCYQKMEDPDRAIEAFGQYLRVAKDLQESERLEIQGYMVEMQELKQKRAAIPSARPRDLNAFAPPADSSSLEASGAGGALGARQNHNLDSLQKSFTAPPPADNVNGAFPSPIYKRWWFWTAAATIAGGVATTIYLVNRAPESPRSEASLGTLDLRRR